MLRFFVLFVFSVLPVFSSIADLASSERWYVDTDRLTPHNIEIRRGETRSLEPTFRSAGSALDLSAATNGAIFFIYRVAGADDRYCVTGSVVNASAGSISIPWAPAHETIATNLEYDLVICSASSGIVRCYGNLTLITPINYSVPLANPQVFTVPSPYALALSADLATSERWYVDTERLAPHNIEIRRGETRLLDPTFRSYGVAMNLSAVTNVLLQYKSSDMTNYYCATGMVLNASNGTVRVPWSISQETVTNRLVYDLVISSLSSSVVRCYGNITLNNSVSYIGTTTNNPPIWTAGTDSMRASVYDPSGANTTAVFVTDARLSDARTPIAHSQANTTISGLGTASTNNSGDFATAAQGVLADTALQPVATQGLASVAQLNQATNDVLSAANAYSDTHGVTDHSALSNLGFSASGHTGFQAAIAGTVVTNGAGMSGLVNDSGYALASATIGNSTNSGHAVYADTSGTSAVASSASTAYTAERWVIPGFYGLSVPTSAPGAGMQIMAFTNYGVSCWVDFPSLVAYADTSGTSAYANVAGSANTATWANDAAHATNADSATTVTGAQAATIASALQSITNHWQAWSTITNTPTSLSAAGITNAPVYTEIDSVWSAVSGLYARASATIGNATNATLATTAITASNLSVSSTLNMAGQNITNAGTVYASSFATNGGAAMTPKAFVTQLVNNDVIIASGTNGLGSTNAPTLAGLSVASGIQQTTAVTSNYFAGRIGVGTNAPPQTLTVNGTFQVNRNSYDGITSAGFSVNSISLRMQNSYTNARNWNLYSSGGGPAPTGHFGVFDDSGGGTRLDISTNGNVGIGTTSAEDLLHVSGANKSILLTGSFAASQTNKVKITNGQTIGGANEYSAALQLMSTAAGIYRSAIMVTAAGVDKEIMTFDQTTANVGIGVFGSTVPNYPLSVGGSTNNSLFNIGPAVTLGGAVCLTIGNRENNANTPLEIRSSVTSFSAGNVLIGNSTGTNILTIAINSPTDPIADSWTTFVCNRSAKYIVEPDVVTNYADSVAAVPIYRWKRKPIVRDDEVLQNLDKSDAIISTDHVLESLTAEVEGRPEPVEVDQKPLVISDFAPETVEAKREELSIAKAALPKFTATHVGIMLDDPQVPREICANSDPNSGVDLVGWCGYLQAALRDEIIARKALEARVKALEGK